jgi:uncharacterized protein
VLRIGYNYGIMNDLETIINKLRELKPILERDYSIKEIGVFGSYVRNEQTLQSDIDVLVSFGENARISLLKFCAFENWLSDILNIKVDLVMKKALKPKIGKKILSEVIYI